MYERIGRLLAIPDPPYRLTWNPPGWGSGPADITMLLGRPVMLAMVVGIQPGGSIPFHRDDPAAENGLGTTPLVRWHVVLTTNHRCWNYHDGDWQQLERGGIYQMDPRKEHASINFGDTVRLHLVVDLDEAQSRCPEGATDNQDELRLPTLRPHE